jgi:hypothetical protein
MRLHGEYVQSQMRSLTGQASEMGQIVSRAAVEAGQPEIQNGKIIFIRYLIAKRCSDAATCARPRKGSIAPFFWRCT